MMEAVYFAAGVAVGVGAGFLILVLTCLQKVKNHKDE